MGRVLVIDDDQAICDMLQRGLEREGFEVETAGDGSQGLRLAEDWQPEVILLDVMLPELDGLEVCRRLRSSNTRNPGIIMLTARTLTGDKIEGLEAGADDYVAKPFHFLELLARVRAQFRRHSGQQDLLHYKGLTLDTVNRLATSGNTALTLTAKECDLLRLFLSAPQQVLTRERLAEEAWGSQAEIESNVIDVYIARLRRKLAMISPTTALRSMRGSGYILI